MFPEESTTLRLSEMQITWEPLSDPEIERLPAEVRGRMQQLFETLHVNPASLVAELEDLTTKYPRVVTLQNWLTASHSALGHDKKAFALTEALFASRPDYLFARTTFAELLLRRDGPRAAREVLWENGSDLTQAYPQRKNEFHISEVRHWFYVGAKIHILEGNPDIALQYAEILEDLEPGSEAPAEIRDLAGNDTGKLYQTLKALAALAKKQPRKRTPRKEKTPPRETTPDLPGLFLEEDATQNSEM